MTPAERLEAAAERFADTLNEAIAARVQYALALERDRHDAELGRVRQWQDAHMFELHNANELAELREDVARQVAMLHEILNTQGGEIARLRGVLAANFPLTAEAHSVKVEP